MLKSVDLQDYMLHNPIKVKEDDNLLDAIDAIVAHKISGLCVVNDRGELIGVLSELDCLRAVLSSTYNESGIGRVKEAMYCGEITVAKPGEDIVDVAQDMLNCSHRRRPVVKDGRLVGQITCRQILSAIKDFYR
ncbi:MAG: CBS domain-containing protein [Oceanicoccus sp.]|jgi:CBS domain-containing protein